MFTYIALFNFIQLVPITSIESKTFVSVLF